MISSVPRNVGFVMQSGKTALELVQAPANPDTWLPQLVAAVADAGGDLDFADSVRDLSRSLPAIMPSLALNRCGGVARF